MVFFDLFFESLIWFSCNGMINAALNPKFFFSQGRLLLALLLCYMHVLTWSQSSWENIIMCSTSWLWQCRSVFFPLRLILYSSYHLTFVEVHLCLGSQECWWRWMRIWRTWLYLFVSVKLWMWLARLVVLRQSLGSRRIQLLFYLQQAIGPN